MADWRILDLARAALADPLLPAPELAAIAAVQPGLWPQVAVHRAAYPELLRWLEERGVAVPPRVQPASPPPVAPQQSSPQSTEASAVPPVISAMPSVFSAQPGPSPYSRPTGHSEDPPFGFQPTPAQSTPPRRRKWLPVAAVAAAVVLVSAVVGIVVSLQSPASSGWKPSSVRTVPPVGGGTTPGKPATPSGDDSAAPSQTTQSSTPGKTSVVPGATPVPVQPGDRVFRVATVMKGTDVTIGFILASDGRQARDFTVTVSGGELADKYDFSKLTHTSSSTYDLDSTGRLRASTGEGVVLEVDISGDVAAGTFTYNTEVGGFTGQPTSVLDLGKVDVALEGRPT